MSRNKHSKTRRNQTTTAQRTSSGQRTAVGRQTATRTQPMPARGQQTAQSDGMSASGRAEDMMSTLSTQGTRALEGARSSLEGARTTLMHVADSALTSIKQNPVPYAMAGVGIACAGAGITWLLLSSAKGAASAASGSSIATPALPERVQSSVKGATKSLKRASEAATQKVSQLAHDAVESGRSLEQSMEGMVREHPIAIGAALIATGAAIGLAIPRSSFEDGWLGRERDQIVSSAKSMAQGAVEKVESIAKQVRNGASNSIAHA